MEYVFESDPLVNTILARTSDAMALSFLCTYRINSSYSVASFLSPTRELDQMSLG